MKKKLFLLVLTCIIGLSAFFAACQPDESHTKAERETITLNKTEDYLAVGESTVLVLKSKPASIENRPVIWSSSDEEVCTVAESGEVTAKKTGSAEIVLSAEGSFIKKSCKIMVADAIVAKGFSKDAKDYGTTRFAKIQDAADMLKGQGGSIIVMEGKYNEDVSLDADFKVLGVGSVEVKTIKCADGKKLEIENMKFYSEQYPEEKEASLYVGSHGSLSAKKCLFVVDRKNDMPGEQEGGFAICTGMLTEKVHINDCKINNYNYGIYIDKTGADIVVKDNLLQNCKKAIGVDIRKPDYSVPENLKPVGMIQGNEFLNNEMNALFYYVGGSFSSKFQFKDFTLSKAGKKKPMEGSEDQQKAKDGGSQ